MKYTKVIFSFLLFVGCFPPTVRSQTSTIALVQHASKDAGTVASATLALNLGATARALNVEWFNPATGATVSGAAITGGSTKSFSAPFSGDAVLYIVDALGHN